MWEGSCGCTFKPALEVKMEGIWGDSVVLKITIGYALLCLKSHVTVHTVNGKSIKALTSPAINVLKAMVYGLFFLCICNKKFDLYCVTCYFSGNTSCFLKAQRFLLGLLGTV